jgi:hypothetical protein
VNNLERRIAALEQRLGPKFVSLKMRDGSQHRIRSDGQHLLALVCAAMRKHHAESLGELVAPSQFDAELKLIAESVSCDEEGGMVGLARVALNSPVGDVQANIADQEGDVGDGE